MEKVGAEMKWTVDIGKKDPRKRRYLSSALLYFLENDTVAFYLLKHAVTFRSKEGT